MKKALLALLVVTLVLTGCTKTDTAKTTPQKLVVWSFTDELGKMIDYYKKANPNVEIEYVVVPNDVYQSKLKPVLQSGQGAPDVFALEAGYVKGYVESGFMADLSGIDAKDTMQYTKDVTLNKDGKVTGLSWQATPGAFFYRRSIAKKYLGTDDPVKVQEMVSDFDKFLAVAETLKSKSNGSVKMIASTGDVFQVYKSGRVDPWVKNNTLIIDPIMIKMLDQVKIMREKGYEARQAQWQEGWFAGMKGSLSDEKGKSVEVFGYMLPTWGLHYVLKANAKAKDGSADTSGDWAMIQGPMSYFWGGTWLAQYSGSKNPEAQKLIKFLTTDETFLEQWAKDTGDLVSNMKVVNKIKDTYTEPFLAGQNHYAAFAEMSKSINGKILTGMDQDIEKIFQEQMEAVVNGEKTRDAAIADFKAAVGSQFPDIKVQ